MKVAVNKEYGGFGLSDKALEMIMRRKGFECVRYKQTKFKYEDEYDEYVRVDDSTDGFDTMLGSYLIKDIGAVVDNLPGELIYNDFDIARTDVDLIAVLEALGNEDVSFGSKVVIIELPDDAVWKIVEHAGYEKLEYEK